MTARERMSLASFDRFFPAQDLLPTKTSGNGSFGNLIALPLNGTTRSVTEPSAPRGSTPQDDTSPIQNLHSEKPTVAEVRAWARNNGHAVPARGRLRADIWTAWHAAHPT